VSAVATLEPEMAAKIAQATTVATASPPGRWRTMVWAVGVEVVDDLAPDHELRPSA
jgi:hypothetical protein